jgi:hypothetical protein
MTEKGRSLLHRVFELQDKIMFALLDKISPESHSVITSLDLKHRSKITFEGARFVDTSHFRVQTPSSKEGMESCSISEGLNMHLEGIQGYSTLMGQLKGW